MSNAPLPDFCVQWGDGAKLRYSLESGRLDFVKVHVQRSSSSAGCESASSSTNRAVGSSASVTSMSTRTTYESLSSSVTGTPTPALASRAVEFRWEGDFSGNTSSPSWTASAPRHLTGYLSTAQRAMQRCLAEERQTLGGARGAGVMPESIKKIGAPRVIVGVLDC